jgi:hypothetical protein
MKVCPGDAASSLNGPVYREPLAGHHLDRPGIQSFEYRPFEIRCAFTSLTRSPELCICLVYPKSCIPSLLFSARNCPASLPPWLALGTWSNRRGAVRCPLDS